MNGLSGVFKLFGIEELGICPTQKSVLAMVVKVFLKNTLVHPAHDANSNKQGSLWSVLGIQKVYQFSYLGIFESKLFCYPCL